MPVKFECGPLQPDEVEAFSEIVIRAFYTPPERMADWFESLGRENILAVRADGRIAGGLSLVRAGQWFGGRNVPMTGVAGVAVAPEHRGAGAASALMRAALEEMRAGGACISTLFPSAFPVYRKAGYERAGSRTLYEMSTVAAAAAAGTSSRQPGAMRLEPLDPKGGEALKEFHLARAREGNGLLDRTPFLWRETLTRPREKRLCYGCAEGYIVFGQEGRRAPLHCHDLCALTPGAWAAIMNFFGAHRSTVETAEWFGSVNDPFTFLLADKVRVKFTVDWMLRLVDAAKALEARGYPPDVEGEAHLDIQDDWFESNSGRFVLRVHDGRASVERGGTGEVRLHIRALAPIYTGHLTPAELRRIGLIDAPARALAGLQRLFAGPRPWMYEMF